MYKILGLFLCLFFPTNLYAQEAALPTLASQQLSLLAEKILENTPEHTHFEKGSHFAWVVLSDIQDNSTALNDEVIKQLKEHYTVYLTKQALPDKLLMKDGNGRLTRYDDGFMFSFKMTWAAKDTIRIDYSDWESNQAGGGHWEKYQWIGSEWKIIEKSVLVVS